MTDKKKIEEVKSQYIEASDGLKEEIRRYLLEQQGYPHIMDDAEWMIVGAVIHFANWQKELMMKEAVECTVYEDAGGYPYINQIELYDYDKDEPLAKTGDKVKVIIMKENEQ